MIEQTNSSDTFWNRICESFFIKSPDWFETVQTLPEKLDLKICLQRTVSGVEQTGIKALGWMGGGIQEEIRRNPLESTDFPLPQFRWAFLQFSLQFFQFEGIYNYLDRQGSANPALWNLDVVKSFIEFAQTMVFYSAMLIICEADNLPDNEADIEPLIRIEIQKIVDVLIHKTTDYGQAFLRHGVPGLLYRVWDKIARYATLSTESNEARYESRKDTVCDMLGYSVLIWSILEGMNTTVSFPQSEGV
jgi:hypothetical protein